MGFCGDLGCRLIELRFRTDLADKGNKFGRNADF
jgi:hypothetical protein